MKKTQIQGDADIFFQVFGLSCFGPKMRQVDEM